MMRYPGGDLAILGVETYPDPLAHTPARSRPACQPKSTAASQRPQEGGPRKRPRVQGNDGGTEKDEIKRARGRPRLDVSDETAADRRRTQIRLAQRAYRNRKETAIQTLEKQVKNLQKVNREMSNAFMKFHDFAVASGLLDSSSELGRRLLATKERFINISQAGGDDTDGNDDHEIRRRGSTSTAESIGSDRRRKGVNQLENQGNSPEYMIGPIAAESSRQLFPGLTVTHEPISQSYLTTAPDTDLSLSIPTTSQTTEFHPTTTAPSFPKTFDLPTVDFNFDFLPPPQHQPQPQVPSPYSALPAPSSYASHEITFGRRYQRFAIERAHMLVTMPNPPIDKLSKAFGFCLLFESPDMIFQRTLKAIARSKNESLFNWQYPFYHLGGAGTHNLAPGGPLNSTLTLEAGMRMHLNFTNASKQPQVGNQGTADVLKPHAELTAGFSMGPFPPAVNNARDNWLDRDMKMCLPGFQGEYYDCDEVEFYFHQRGVIIPPGADEYTVEIYPAQFGMATGGAGGVGGPGSGSLEEMDLACLDSVVYQQNFTAGGGNVGSPPSSMDYSSNSIVSDEHPSYQQQQTTKPLTPSGSSSLSPPSTTAVDDWAARFLGTPAHNDTFDFPSHPSPAPENNNNMYMSPKSSHSSQSATTGTGSTAATSFDQPQPQPQQVWNQRMLVTIDVNQLVIELTERAICLGRTPGIRPDDINAAFWKSLCMSVSL
ncbi:hypothetical protein B0T20DRAFT_121591 [Sordaria brevicollis]|uniref:BZIP domain-containing protein n=1 Tax=Sordaria brevicollis TaxID=83679 RepID=A0AAE0PKW8_SORBR|nr:hypothetical protein B0T20DRAFT_121591 [Sordaria brevicollis]